MEQNDAVEQFAFTKLKNPVTFKNEFIRLWEIIFATISSPLELSYFAPICQVSISDTKQFR